MKNFLLWFFGIALIGNGIGNVVAEGYFFAGLIGVLCGFVILPPIKNIVRQRVGFHPLLVLGVAAVGLTASVWNSMGTARPAVALSPSEQKTQDSTNAVNARNNKIADDAKYAYIKADRAIKKALKDPDSYERIDERSGYVGKDGIYVSCLVTYRANNSFGGKAVEKMLVNFNENMEPIALVPVTE